MDRWESSVRRRALLGRIGAAAAAAALLGACDVIGARSSGGGEAPRTAPLAPAANPNVVRLSSVVIPQESKLYEQLLPDFERRTGNRVEVTTAQDVYGPARAGKFDIALSHYQHEGLSSFVQDGFGEWPRTVFSSPIAVIGPVADPAGIRRGTDVVEAFRKISRAGAQLVVNDQDGLRYVGEVAARAAGLQTSGAWYVDRATRGPQAMNAAAQAGAYTLWGLVPFLRLQQQARLPLAVLLTQDQLLRSVMVTTLVKASRVPGVNATGARALQHYLMDAETQAKIRAFRMEGTDEQLWWPAAHDNEKTSFERP